MIPEPKRALTAIAERLLTHVAPQTTNLYTATDTGLVAQLLSTFAQEFEGAVQSRMEDIEAMKALFATAPEAQARLQYLSAEPESLHLAHVNQLHAQGLALLIDLHGWAEENDAALNHTIWALLREMSERHKFEG